MLPVLVVTVGRVVGHFKQPLLYPKRRIPRCYQICIR